ncbi:MAG TPA: YfhO family protein [bacterium]|nr:YfhO family protein [bacterium]
MPWLLVLAGVYLAPYAGREGGVAGKYIWDEHCVAHTYPVAWLAREEVRSGHFPLWNPFSGCGLPLLANTLDETILPYSIVKYLFPFPLGLNLFLAIKLLISLAGAFALSRGLGASRRGAILGAVVYGFTGFNTLNINSVIGPVFLLPWCVFAMHRLALLPRFSSALLVAAAFGLSLMGGNPQIPFEALVIGYGLYLITLFARKTPLRPGRYVLLPAAAVAAGALLALPQLLPFTEYLARAFSHHIPGYGELHLDPRGLIGVMSPLWDAAIVHMNAGIMASLQEFFAARFPPATWNNATFPVPFEYAGTIAVFFFIFSLASLKRLTAETGFFCIVVIASLGLAFGIFPFSLLASVPPFTQVSNWRFTTFTTGLAASALAGPALERLHLPAFRRPLILSLVLLCVISGAGAAMLVAQAGLPLDSPFIRGPALAFAAVLALLGLALFIRRPWPLIALAAIELLAYDRALDRRLLPHPFKQLARPDVAACVPPGPEYRFIGRGETLHPSLGIFLGRHDFRSYEMIFPDALVRTIAAANGWDRSQTVIYYLTHYYFTLEPRALTSPFAAQASVRSLIADDFLPPPELIPGLFKNALVIAPLPGYIQPIRQEIQRGARNGWLQHAPSALIMGPGADGLQRAPAGFIALMPRALAEPGDGVIMQVAEKSAAGAALIYSRYLDPRREPAERKWVPVRLAAAPRSAPVFSVLPGPNNDARSDYALWADFHDPGKRAAFERVWKLEDTGESKCYHNDQALPRLRVAKNVAVVPDFDSCLAGLRARRWSGGTEAVVDGLGSPWPAGPGRVADERFSADRVTATVDMDGAGALILADTYYPGWQAAIDGAPAPIHRADCAFRAIQVPQGHHSIAFTFVPAPFRIGLWCALMSWIVFIGAMVSGRVNRQGDKAAK